MAVFLPETVYMLSAIMPCPGTISGIENFRLLGKMRTLGNQWMIRRRFRYREVRFCCQNGFDRIPAFTDHTPAELTLSS